MKKINSGKLRAIGYDARARLLQVQLDNGDTLQFSGVGEDLWRAQRIKLGMELLSGQHRKGICGEEGFVRGRIGREESAG